MPSVDPAALYASNDLSWLDKPDREVEGQHVERKEWCAARDIASCLSAFANGHTPGGLFVLGVTATGEIKGIQDRARAASERMEQLPSLIEDCDHKHRIVSLSNGTEVLLILVPYCHDRVICLSDGTAYRRVGATTQKMTPAQIEAMRSDKGEHRFEDRPVASLDAAHISEILADELLRGLRDKNDLSLPLTLDDALTNRRLLVPTSKGDRLTIAGVLALSNEPTEFLGGARLRFLRFDGTVEKFGAERNVVKDGWFDGAIPIIVRKFRDFMRTQVREFDYLGDDGKFVTEQEYPEFVWEEAVINALVHRSYSFSNVAVFVRMFDDRLEIESPGGFPPPGVESPVQIENLSSNPRNPRLANALRYFGLVRLAQEGTRRMAAEMARLGLPAPLLEEIKNGGAVQVTLRNDIDARRARAASRDFSHSWKEIEQKLSDNLALYRRKAIDRWQGMRNKGASPPEHLLQTALRLMIERQLTEEEALRIVQMAKSDSFRAMAADIETALVAGDLDWSPRLAATLAVPLSHSEQTLMRFLGRLEKAPFSSAPWIEPVFLSFYERLHREPLPERDWLQRVIAVSRNYAQISSWARRVHEEITGHEPV